MLNYIETFPDSVEMEELLVWLKALADPKRLRIFNLLMEGVQCNCEIGDVLDMAPNLISHHLNKLRAVGLVDAERDAGDSRWIYYSINRTALEKVNVALGAFLNPQRIQPRQPACGPRAESACTTDFSLNKDDE